MAKISDPVVQKWVDRMKVAESNQEEGFKKFATWFDDMYAVVKDADFSAWRSKVYFPRLTAKLWQMIPKLVMGVTGFRVSARGDQPDLDGAKLMKTLLDYQYDNPEFDEPMFKKLSDVLIDSMVTGKGIAHIPWTTKRKRIYDRSQEVIDPETGEITKTLMLDEVAVKEFLVAYPDFQPINIFNFFYSPSGASLQKKHWLILKDFKTVQELKEANEKSGVEMYKNLDALKDLKSGSDKYSQYNYSRNRLNNEMDPIQLDQTITQIEVWRCYDRADNAVAVVCPAAGVVLQESKNPYWHGKYPFVDFEIKPRAHEFWGEGLFEVTKRLQSAVNSIFNHYFDNLNLSLDGMLLKGGNTTIFSYDIMPGGILDYEGEKPDQFKFPAPDPAQLQIADTVLSRAIDESTISPYAAGNPNDLTDTTQGTMGGIMALQRAADDLMSYMKNCFASSVRQFGIMWIQDDQQFMDRIIYIQSIDKGETVNQEIDPAMIQGQYDLKMDDISDKPSDPEQDKMNFRTTIDRIIMLKKSADEQAMIQASGRPIGVVLNYDALIKEEFIKAGIVEASEFLDASQAMPKAMGEDGTMLPTTPDPSMFGLMQQPGMGEGTPMSHPGPSQEEQLEENNAGNPMAPMMPELPQMQPSQPKGIINNIQSLFNKRNK